jgi:hypothetical protein
MSWRRLDWCVGARSGRLWTMEMQMERMRVHSDAVAEVWGVRHVADKCWELPKGCPAKTIAALDLLINSRCAIICLFLVTSN